MVHCGRGKRGITLNRDLSLAKLSGKGDNILRFQSTLPLPTSAISSTVYIDYAQNTMDTDISQTMDTNRP